jgi:hypothetical protein
MKARKPTLMDALSFNQEDLRANREGRLGRHQIRGARVNGGIWIAMGVLLIVAMGVGVWAQLSLDDPNVGGAIFAVVLAVFVGGFCLLVGFGTVAARKPSTPVRCLTGEVRPAAKKPYWYAGETQFRGPSSGASNWTNPFYTLLKDHPVCHVYVAGRTAVSIERIEDAAAP